MKEIICAVIGVITILLVSFLIVYYFDKASCFAKSKAMNFEATHSAVEGCIITLPNGNRVPLNSYRVIGD